MWWWSLALWIQRGRRQLQLQTCSLLRPAKPGGVGVLPAKRRLVLTLAGVPSVCTIHFCRCLSGELIGPDRPVPLRTDRTCRAFRTFRDGCSLGRDCSVHALASDATVSCLGCRKAQTFDTPDCCGGWASLSTLSTLLRPSSHRKQPGNQLRTPYC